jgi:anti-sigma B factor antagonist
MSQAPSSRLRLENVDGVTIVSFADTRIVDEEVVKEVGDQLYDLVDVEGHKKLLVNFGNVEFCASIMLGKLVNLQKKVAALQGKLKLCCLKPDLLYIFRLTQLDKVLEIHQEEQAALDKF